MGGLPAQVTARRRPTATTWTGFTLFLKRLQEREKQAAGSMSGGEQQMLAIGRALMSRRGCCCSTSRRWASRPS